METPTFDTGFESCREFYVRNDIFKVFIVVISNSNVGKLKLYRFLIIKFKPSSFVPESFSTSETSILKS